MFIGQGLFQFKAITIRVPGQLTQFFSNGFKGLWAWTKRVFIRGQLDNILDTVFALQLFNGFARLIGGQGAHTWHGQFIIIHLVHWLRIDYYRPYLSSKRTISSSPR